MKGLGQSCTRLSNPRQISISTQYPARQRFASLSPVGKSYNVLVVVYLDFIINTFGKNIVVF